MKSLIVVRNISKLGGVERVTINLQSLLKSFNIGEVSVVSLYGEKIEGNCEVLFQDSKINKNILEEYIKSVKPDNVIIQVQDLKEALIIANTSKKSGLKVFPILHTSPFFYTKHFYPGKYSSLINFLKYIKKMYYWRPRNIIELKKLLTISDKFICVGKTVASELAIILNNYKVEKIDFIENPHVIENTEIAVKENLIVFAGRFSEEKQIEKIIEAWSKVFENNDTWKLILLGDGHLFDFMKDYADHLNVKNLIFKGQVENVAHYLNKSKITILFSLFEGYPTVLLEALHNQNALICYDGYGGSKDLIIDRFNGYLINENTADALAEKLHTLMNDNYLLDEFSKNSKILVERYSNDKIANKWKILLTK